MTESVRDIRLDEPAPCIPEALRVELTTVMGKIHDHGIVMLGFMFRPDPLAIENYMNCPMTKQEFLHHLMDLVRLVNTPGATRADEIHTPSLIAEA